MDAALRRGISTAYYSIFHDLTRHTASHLLGSCPQEIQNEIRVHGLMGKSRTLRSGPWCGCPSAPVPGHLEKLGPLLDVVAQDAALVDTLRLFNDLQEQRHSADYDHEVKFLKLDLAQACRNARLARRRLSDASSAAREALFTLLTVRRADFRQR